MNILSVLCKMNFLEQQAIILTENCLHKPKIAPSLLKLTPKLWHQGGGSEKNLFPPIKSPFDRRESEKSPIGGLSPPFHISSRKLTKLVIFGDDYIYIFLYIYYHRQISDIWRWLYIYKNILQNAQSRCAFIMQFTYGSFNSFWHPRAGSNSPGVGKDFFGKVPTPRGENFLKVPPPGRFYSWK